MNFCEFLLIVFGLEFLVGAKDLFGNMQNSEGGLRLNASAMDSLPQLVENPCIKRSNTRCVCVCFCDNFDLCYCSKI